jgi:EAL domain-containing protein (putative c-di-GMP-specific phosphodiesterase class I)
VAVRMLDLQGKDVLPSEFLPAAARNGLLRDIDRWVVGAALRNIVTRHPDLLFVRLSSDSIHDPSLPEWLAGQLQQVQAEPRRLCVQFTEADMAANTPALQQLLGRLRKQGIRTAIEHFGTRNDALTLLSGMSLDFLKIDGSLMQSLAGNNEQQTRIRQIAEAAARLQVQTVAERIEDANTMAIVWQLGVQFIQGYLVHAPEEVVLSA